MNAVEVLQQAKALGSGEITQDLAEQTFVKVAIIEHVLGLPSDRKASISQRADVALAAIDALEKLHSTPLPQGASLEALQAYHEQQAQVLQKLVALQTAVSNTVAGAVISFKAIDEFRKSAQSVIDQWVQEANQSLNTIPIKEIVAASPRLAKEIEIIDIPHPGNPVSLFRLKSHPEIGFPIWPLSKNSSGTLGRISIRIQETDATEDRGSSKGSDAIVKNFRSVCACCVTNLIGESPYVASLPEWTPHNEAERKAWTKSPDGVAHEAWYAEQQRAFVLALKQVCEANGIKVIAARKPDRWAESFPEEMRGFEVVCTGSDSSGPKAIYEKYLPGRTPKDFSDGGVFKLSRYGNND
jgi:hypothetical protein